MNCRVDSGQKMVKVNTYSKMCKTDKTQGSSLGKAHSVASDPCSDSMASTRVLLCHRITY